MINIILEFRAILNDLSKESVKQQQQQLSPASVMTASSQHDHPEKRRDTASVLSTTEVTDTVLEHKSSSQIRSKISKDDVLIKSSTSRFFCGEGRSRSPFG